MAAEEDIFLREVDDDLKQDQTIAFFKRRGPLLGTVAALAIVVVASLQFIDANENQASSRSAVVFRDALATSDAAGADGAQMLLSAADELNDGYAALARIRSGALLVDQGKTEEGLSVLREVYESNALPSRLRDVARLKAAYALVDPDPPLAADLATAVETPAMRPYAEEVAALAALAQEDFETAYATLSALADQEVPGTTRTVAGRAGELAALADAGRRGIALEPETSEAENFIQSFSEQLEQDLADQDAPSAEAAGAEGTSGEEREAQSTVTEPDGDNPD